MHHRRGLRRLLNNDRLAKEIEIKQAAAKGLSEKQATMISYALKLTKTPAEMSKEDVQSLKTAGFTDLDILHIAETTAYFAYVNRLADGLGVCLEPK